MDNKNEKLDKLIKEYGTLFNKYDYGFNIVVMNERGDFILNILFASPVVSEKFSLLQINDSYYDCSLIKCKSKQLRKILMYLFMIYLII